MSIETLPPDPPPVTDAGAPPPEHRGFAAVVLASARQLVVPILSLVTALLIGAIVIILSDPEFIAKVGSDPGAALGAGFGSVGGAYRGLLEGSIGNPFRDIGPVTETLLRATPLIFAGLAVAIGFRAGLFNIGAEGQIYIGALFATAVGIGFTDLPLLVHLPLAVAAGFAGGAVWGFIPGILKARTGAHEVITTIMLNYVSYSIIDLALRQVFFQLPGRDDPISKNILPSATLPRLLPDERLHWGLILALLAAVAVWWLLFRSTKGFEFRAVGLNPAAARYAGMNISRTVVLTMMISGGLAGLAGTSEIIGTNLRLTPNFSPNWGFDAIAIALLGASRPVGVVFSAILFGALRAGAAPMQAQTGIPIDLVVVIQGLVILFIAAPALVRAIYRIRVARTTGTETFSKGWGA
ncbi:MAG TPA: ABC transporter permease [Candidatus Limnocylindria bacterium]|nr:ABC transporter permease [Candidatus Limnocylindria bacterium]